MAAAELKTDPFSARDTFDTGSGEAGIYRPVEARRGRADLGWQPAIFDSRVARIVPA